LSLKGAGFSWVKPIVGGGATPISDQMGVVSETFLVGDNTIQTNGAAGAVNRDTDAVFAADVTFSATAQDGIIFEAGGTGEGAAVYILGGSNDLLICQCGSGRDPYNVADERRALVTIPYSQVAGQTGELAWVYVINTTDITLETSVYFKGMLLAQNTSITIASEKWAGTNVGTYLGLSTQAATGVPRQDSPSISNASDLRYWENDRIPT